MEFNMNLSEKDIGTIYNSLVNNKFALSRLIEKSINEGEKEIVIKRQKQQLKEVENMIEMFEPYMDKIFDEKESKK